MEIRIAQKCDTATVARLCCALWSDSDVGETSVAVDMDSGRNAFFLAFDGERAVGFCHVSLRSDYVEGCDTSPVGYLEGIYVEPSYRRKGVARQLVERGERWVSEHGCTEFASDRELHNADSEAFHLSVGFREANRVVSYRKAIEKSDDYIRNADNTNFWSELDRLVAECETIIDRPAGSAHPRYPDFVYPHDYGYLEGTSSMDGGGIDIWRGTLQSQMVCGVVIILDMRKRDSEIKVLIGCTDDEIADIVAVHNSGGMSGVLVRRNEI